MTLIEATEGESLVITKLAGEEIAMQAIRFGLDEGTQIKLTQKLPGGPVIVVKNQLEIAIGRALAGLIQVRRQA